MVPKLHSAFFAILGLHLTTFGRLGVLEVGLCGTFPGTTWQGEKNMLPHQKLPCGSKFCEPNFQEFRLKWWRKELFCIVGTSWMGWGRVEWDWHMGMSYLISLNPKLLKNIAYFHSTRCWLQLKSLICYFRSYHTWLISGRNLDWAYHRGCKHSGIGWWGSRCIASFTALPRQIPTSFVGPI